MPSPPAKILKVFGSLGFDLERGWGLGVVGLLRSEIVGLIAIM
jgi:hypothetical protein